MNRSNLTLRIAFLALLTTSLGAGVSGYSTGSIANLTTVHNGYVSIYGSRIALGANMSLAIAGASVERYPHKTVSE